MRPTASIIVFTTTSGAGFGLLVLLIAGHMGGLIGTDAALLGAGFGIAYVLITAGLIGSTFHLGHPERMLLALTQWRSSWLSREALLALASYPLGLAYLGWIFTKEGNAGVHALGAAALLVALATIYCTGMIYASLRAIFAWHTILVPASYLALALMTGALLLVFLGVATDSGALGAFFWLAVGLALVGLALKLAYWRRLDTQDAGQTAEAATGLGRFGKVRQFEAPSTGRSYIMHEMGFAIARRHARALRRATLAFGFLAPLLCLILGALLPNSVSLALVVVAVILMALGIAIERWLFFAEAKHAATLYHGASRV
ncbi:MAG: dimethyl sulfoxide reductase anchor subunit family protein [Alphaproteobacteria bacterium]